MTTKRDSEFGFGNRTLTMQSVIMGGKTRKPESMPPYASAQMRRRSVATETGPVVPFPAERRTAQIRRCAGELDGLHGDDARLYWRKVCHELADEMRKLGSSEDNARAAVFAFQDEVQQELFRMHHAEEA
nr:DUF6074 family protein [uncultured Shinella sp.]